jgi:hypothetical protein
MLGEPGWRHLGLSPPPPADAPTPLPGLLDLLRDDE